MITQHRLCFLHQAFAQGLRLQDMHVAAPTEEPLEHFAHLPYPEGDHQPFGSLFLRDDVEGA